MKGLAKTIIIVIIFITSSYSFASSPPTLNSEFETGVEAYESGNYDQSISILSTLLNELKLTSIDRIIKAHSILGASYLFKGDDKNCAKHFKAVLNFNMEHQLSANYFPPKVIHRFNEIKKMRDLEEKTGELDAQAQVEKSEPTQKSVLKSSKDPQDLKAKGIFPEQSLKRDPNYRNHYFHNFLPFGIGQFKNGERTKGYLFLASEIVTLASTITTIVLFESLKNPDGTFNNPSTGRSLKAGFYSSLAVYLFLTITGITDALINYVEYPYANSANNEQLFHSGETHDGGIALLVTVKNF